VWGAEINLDSTWLTTRALIASSPTWEGFHSCIRHICTYVSSFWERIDQKWSDRIGVAEPVALRDRSKIAITTWNSMHLQSSARRYSVWSWYSSSREQSNTVMWLSLQLSIHITLRFAMTFHRFVDVSQALTHHNRDTDCRSHRDSPWLHSSGSRARSHGYCLCSSSLR
jgi:head-tail adaptor